MKKFLNYTAVVLLLLISFSCEEENGIGDSVNYVSFESDEIGFQVVGNSTSEKEVKIYTGNKIGSDRTFSVFVNESSTLTANYLVPAAVTVLANTNVGVLTVSVTDDETLEFEPQTLVIEFLDGDGVFIGLPVTLNVAEACPGTLVRFNLTLDTWPDETSWEIYDLSGTPSVIYSGGPYVNPDDDFAELSFEYCMLPGDYGVVVYDAYGDGGPTFSVTTADGNLVPETTLAGAESSATFTVD
jgi:hypothetical protein